MHTCTPPSLSGCQVPTSSDRLRLQKECMGFNIERLSTRVNTVTNMNVYGIKCTLLHSDDTRDPLVCHWWVVCVSLVVVMVCACVCVCVCVHAGAHACVCAPC